MIFNLIHSARWGDTILLAMDVAVFWLLIASSVALGVGVAWLANRRQPVPKVSAAEPGMGIRAGTWEWNEIRRRRA